MKEKSKLTNYKRMLTKKKKRKKERKKKKKKKRSIKVSVSGGYIFSFQKHRPIF